MPFFELKIMKHKKRNIEVAVISDVHLGTYGCHAEELVKYLKSIQPQKIILNGDIIDIWQFNKNYWPKSHMQVVKQICSHIAKGTEVYYVTGNHDELLRKFAGFKIGSFEIVNKVSMDLDGKKAWIFHGDVFDVSMRHSKWLTKLGSSGYDLLILLNKFVNIISEKLGKGKISLSKKIKDSVKTAVKYINNFEETVVEIAARNNYDYVICGHIHKPEIRNIKIDGKEVTYLNSGDWIENLTSLEYNNGEWSLYKYKEETELEPYAISASDQEVEMLSTEEIFNQLIREFNFPQ